MNTLKFFLNTLAIFLLLMGYNAVAASFDLSARSEKSMAHAILHDAEYFGVTKVSKEHIKIIIQDGIRLHASHWKIDYDHLLYYAQEGLTLPPIDDFEPEVRNIIIECWKKANRICGHKIDPRGIFHLIRDLKLQVAADHWLIDERALKFYGDNKIPLPPLEDFTWQDRQILNKNLIKLGQKAPKIAKARPSEPIKIVPLAPLATKPFGAEQHSPVAISNAPSFFATAQPQNWNSPCQENQYEVLPELADIKYDIPQTYLSTELSHVVQPEESPKKFYQPTEITSGQPVKEMAPKPALNWNIWGRSPQPTTTTNANSIGGDLLLPDAAPVAFANPQNLLPQTNTSSEQQLVSSAPAAIHCSQEFGFDFTLVSTKPESTSSSDVEMLQARLANLNPAASPEMPLSPAQKIQQDDTYEEDLNNRINDLHIDIMQRRLDALKNTSEAVEEKKMKYQPTLEQ